MWPLTQMKINGVRFSPRENSFTYTFPPPHFASKRGLLRTPLSFTDGSLSGRLSLYLHIPFCEMDCSFCSLHRTAIHSSDMLKRYLSCLKLELTSLKELNVRASLDSVYIGGGTPTIYSALELGELLDAVGTTFIIATDGVEVSLECAPSTARSYNEWRTYFDALSCRRTLPVTRLSFGMQAGDSASLRHMGRMVAGRPR